MKHIVVAAAILTVVAVAGLRTVNAQSADFMTVTIPFDFEVSNRTFQAGDYRVKRSIEGSRVVIQLMSKFDDKSIYLPIHSVRSLEIQSTSKLIFNHYGDQFFLRQVWLAGRIDGQELPKTKREQTVQRNVAMNKRKAGIIEVAGNE